MVALLLTDFEDASRDWFWACDAHGRLTRLDAPRQALGRSDASTLLGVGLIAALETANATRRPISPTPPACWPAGSPATGPSAT